ncbi:uncharacterized protein EV420DRAFT_1488574 [Desarmillaria tabescens]|uniref:Uncharacterized protein n=1 Tax=Armillaria tabescens TaxID=1929756 RepID=A0AA39J221_ARMTA|nr:uncharacterized protein EV420DRAFT_1488574 [Desarmillaria tabescens]KAK0434663.1 hypothetical protein EV420DRAFT_1488574 [Desarmillaria tabescens]
MEQEIAIHEDKPTLQDDNSNHQDLEQWLQELLERYRKSRAQAVTDEGHVICLVRHVCCWVYRERESAGLLVAKDSQLSSPCFQLGMSVHFGKNKTLGLVEAVSHDILELMDLNGGGSTIVSWQDVCKDIQVSNYVEITGLVTVGSWVDHIKGNNVNIIQQFFSTHCNCAVVTTPPHSKATVTPFSIQEHQVPVPWVGIEVTIEQPHHRLCGYHGTIRDMTLVPARHDRPGVPGWHPMPTYTSGLCLLVELNHISGANLWHVKWFAYEDLWERQLLNVLQDGKLLLIFQPLLHHQDAYRPPPGFIQKQLRWPVIQVPAPEPQACLATPLASPTHGPLWASYWWEHPDLHDKEMCVFLPSHKKEVVVKAMTLGGQVALARTFFSKPAAMDYTQVKIRHPHQCDYDLWLIIHGEHVVRIVHVKSGEVNTPTDITICLPATHLVLVPEQPDDKKLNDDLKRTLRKQFEELAGEWESQPEEVEEYDIEEEGRPDVPNGEEIENEPFWKAPGWEEKIKEDYKGGPEDPSAPVTFLLPPGEFAACL